MTDRDPMATPEPLAVEFDGQRVDVQPMCLQQIIDVSGELRALVPAIQPVIAAMTSGEDAASAVLNLLGSHGESVLRVIARCTGVDLAALQGSRDLAGVVALGAAVVRVNVDFFARQASEIGATLAKAGMSPGAGKTESTSLSPPATH